MAKKKAGMQKSVKLLRKTTLTHTYTSVNECKEMRKSDANKKKELANRMKSVCKVDITK